MDNTVPYLIQDRFPESTKQIIQKALREYTVRTCVKFVPRTIQENYVEFIVGEGCVICSAYI